MDGTDIAVLPDILRELGSDDFTLSKALSGTVSVREGAVVIKGRISAARFSPTGGSVPENVSVLNFRR